MKLQLKDCKITHERANQLKEEYVNTRANSLNIDLHRRNHFRNRGAGFIEDVRDVTFDLEILEEYIAYVKEEANKEGLTNLGLRVYLGAYPKNDTTKNIKNPGYSNMFFMPTHQENNDDNRSRDGVIQGVDGLNIGHQGLPPNRIL
ncbi:MAG: hypothetical protein ACPGTO_07010 [Polaribacter sp.]